MDFKIALVPGDGIGPEVIEETIKVLNKIGEKYNHKFHHHRACRRSSYRCSGELSATRYH